jgi:predicted RNase H-like nuclease
VVDSAACCLTAEMHERMATEPFPPDDASDTHGRPMRIWAPIVRSTNP